MEYYLSNGNGQKEGPYSLEDLKWKITNRNALVWKTGMSTWVPVTQVPELADVVQNLLSEPRYAAGGAPPLSSSSASPSSNVGNAIPPKTWLVESILATILCCLVPGIVGIVYASKVESTFLSGNRALAEQYSRQAKTWTLVSAGIGVAVVVLYIIYFVLIIGVGAYSAATNM